MSRNPLDILCLGPFPCAVTGQITMLPLARPFRAAIEGADSKGIGQGQMAAIIFDLDGTLIDAAPDICATANTVLAEEGAAPISLDETKSFIGNGALVFVERMSKLRNLPEAGFEARHRRFQQVYVEAHDHTVIYEGAVAALDDLRAAGHRLGLCTNKPLLPTQSVLAHFDLDGYFDHVIAGDSLPQRKPDPAPLQAVIAALGVSPVIYVGDSMTDALTAKSAGVPFLLYTEGYNHGRLAEMERAASFSHHRDMAAQIQAILACEA